MRRASKLYVESAAGLAKSKTGYTTALASLALAAAATLGLPASSQGAECPDADAVPLLTLFNVPRFESSLLCLINQERIERGLQTVRPNAQLAQAAAAHTASMRWQSFFAHESLDGTVFEQRIEATGYLNGAENWLVGRTSAGAARSSAPALDGHGVDEQPTASQERPRGPLRRDRDWRRLGQPDQPVAAALGDRDYRLRNVDLHRSGGREARQDGRQEAQKEAEEEAEEEAG